MIKKILLVVLLTIGLMAIVIVSYFHSFDMTATTSTQSMSGLWNPQVLVSDADLPTGTTKICTGINYVNIKVSEYDKKELVEYNENGIMYDQPIIYEGKIKPFSCTSIEIEEDMVLEGFNHDWGKVKYFINFEDE